MSLSTGGVMVSSWQRVDELLGFINGRELCDFMLLLQHT